MDLDGVFQRKDCANLLSVLVASNRSSLSARFIFRFIPILIFHPFLLFSSLYLTFLPYCHSSLFLAHSLILSLSSSPPPSSFSFSFHNSPFFFCSCPRHSPHRPSPALLFLLVNKRILTVYRARIICVMTTGAVKISREVTRPIQI